MISNATKCSILRWIHLVFSIPIIGYVYSPFEEIPNYAPAVRFVFLPVIVLSGFSRRLTSGTPVPPSQLGVFGFSLGKFLRGGVLR
jgi:hypothetical protein